MASEGPVQVTTYEVYCRECDWGADRRVDLKGEANLLAGRHISQTGHIVALKTVERPTEEAEDFYRGGRSVSVEILRPADLAEEAAEVRECGPVDCVVETA